MVHAFLDCINDCSVLCIPTLSQHLETGKYFRIADEYCCVYCITAGIWLGNYLYASSDAKGILFHGIYYQLLYDDCAAVLLPNVPDIFRQPRRGRR